MPRPLLATAFGPLPTPGEAASPRDPPPSPAYDPPMTNLETGRVSDRHPPFKYSALSRVSFSDTDAQGVVYYGRYLPYFDSARLEYHRHLGLQAYWQSPHEFVMRWLEVTYEAPARFDELLDVHVRTTRIGRSSVSVEGAAYRVDDHVLMCTARMTLVLIEVETRRPVRVPDDYRRAIAAFEGAGVEIATA
jgi:acyl-CoA thioester hydrolase